MKQNENKMKQNENTMEKEIITGKLENLQAHVNPISKV